MEQVPAILVISINKFTYSIPRRSLTCRVYDYPISDDTKVILDVTVGYTDIRSSCDSNNLIIKNQVVVNCHNKKNVLRISQQKQ